jgi:AMMECR1 domain-containing protein
VIVRNGNRSGLLLPDLEGVNSPDEQIRIAKRKAGIAEGEPVELFRFTVTRHV